MLWGVFISEVGQNIKGQLVGVALSFLRKFGILSGASGVLGALSSEVASAALDDRFAVQRAQQKQVVYEVQPENCIVVMVVLYLVYAEPSNQCCQTDILPQQRSQADMHDGYQWHLVTRSECSKGCQGPLLHTAQRYGSLGCRSTGPSSQVQTDSCLVKKKQNSCPPGH
ncbi:TPA: hypothetical protein ACH3X3_005093 [Trebouxia sp. C0006]